MAKNKKDSCIKCGCSKVEFTTLEQTARSVMWKKKCTKCSFSENIVE